MNIKQISLIVVSTFACLVLAFNVKGSDELSDKKIECDKLFDNGVYVYVWRGVNKPVVEYHYSIVISGGESLIEEALSMVQKCDKDILTQLLTKYRDFPDSPDIKQQHILVIDGFSASADRSGSSPVRLSHLLFGGQYQELEDAFTGVIKVYMFDYQQPNRVIIKSINDLIGQDLQKHTTYPPSDFLCFPDGEFEILPTDSSHTANLGSGRDDALKFVFIKNQRTTYCFEKGRGMSIMFSDNLEGTKYIWPYKGSIQQIYALTPKIEFIHRQFVRIENGDLIVTFPK